jgi:hypothetical protein
MRFLNPLLLLARVTFHSRSNDVTWRDVGMIFGTDYWKPILVDLTTLCPQRSHQKSVLSLFWANHLAHPDPARWERGPKVLFM